MITTTKMVCALNLFLSHSLQMINLLLLKIYLLIMTGSINGLIYQFIKRVKPLPIPSKKPLFLIIKPLTNLLLMAPLRLPIRTPHKRLLCKSLKYGMITTTKTACALNPLKSHCLQIANLLHLLLLYLQPMIGSTNGLIYQFIKMARLSLILSKKHLYPIINPPMNLLLVAPLPLPIPMHL